MDPRGFTPWTMRDTKFFDRRRMELDTLKGSIYENEVLAIAIGERV